MENHAQVFFIKKKNPYYKYQKLINKSRPPLNDLSEEDIKVHKENAVKILSTVEIP